MSDRDEFDIFGDPDPAELAASATPDPGHSRFGVVIFDDGLVGSGWACRDGQEPFRISGTGDLDNSTLWLTDADWEEARDSGLSMNPWCLHSNWARLSLKQMRDEWGMTHSDPASSSVQLASCFGRIMRYSFEGRGMNPHSSPLPRVTNLQSWFAGLHPEPEIPPRHLTDAAIHSLQEQTRTQQRGVDGGRFVTLRAPRLAYARVILSAPVPKGPWEMVDGRQMPPMEKRARWLADIAENRPVLANVKMRRATDSKAEVFAFGIGSKFPREWVSGPELRVLERLAELQIETAWLGSELVPGVMRLPSVAKDRLDDQLSTLSWSLGVYAENLWLAGTRPPIQSKSKSRSPGSSQQRQPPTFRGVWMRAYDRITLFAQAVKLTELGYRVLGYSIGGIQVSIQDEMIGNLMSDAFGLGLLPNLSVTAAPELDRYIKPEHRSPPPGKWGGGAGVIEALLRLKGIRSHVEELDVVPELPSEDAKRVIAALVKKL